MKHYQTKPTFVATPPKAAVSMRALLEERKASLEAQVRDKFRAARTTLGLAPADVKSLSAALRAIKSKLAALPKPAPGGSNAR